MTFWLGFLLALVIAILGTISGILANWIPKPTKLRTWHVVALLVVVTLLLVSIGKVQEEGSSDISPGADSGSPGSVDSVMSIAPDLANRIILTSDDSSGSPILFSSRIDGASRQRLWAIGSDLTPVFTPHSTNVVVPQSVGDSHKVRLEVRTVNGELLRVLTHPAGNQNDMTPAIVASKNAVYFVRNYFTPFINGSATLSRSSVMRVPIDGSTDESPVSVPIPLESVSASGDGEVVAGICANADSGGPSQICIIRPGSDDVLRIPGSEHATMSDAAVSPDGKWVAYTSVVENPYGVEQVYVYNLATKRSVMLSRLVGTNNQPAWPVRSKNTCLAFTHSENDVSSIFLGCLMPQPTTTKMIPVGRYPVWFPDS